jgi:hypothetical protein
MCLVWVWRSGYAVMGVAILRVWADFSGFDCGEFRLFHNLRTTRADEDLFRLLQSQWHM